MPPIQSHQDLLVHLAVSGDPSAFYTLAAPCVQATYACLRNQGKSHGDAMAILTPFLKKIYKNYPNGSHDTPFNAWYESQRKKLLPDAVDSQNADAHRENIPAEDISHFESQMRLVFQINYGKLRRAKNGSVIRPWFFFRFMFKFVAAAVCLLAIVIGLQILLTMTGITVSVSSASHTLFFSLPSAINKHFFSIATPAMQKPVAPTTSLSKTDTAKTLKDFAPGGGDSSLTKEKIFVPPRQGAGAVPAAAPNRDSISRPLPVKKPASSRHRASTASSSGLEITPAPAAQARPLPDTEVVKSNQAQAEKSSSTQEKTTTLPSFQKKQLFSLPDSSNVAP